jgi:hypothetical protein
VDLGSEDDESPHRLLFSDISDHSLDFSEQGQDDDIFAEEEDDIILAEEDNYLEPTDPEDNDAVADHEEDNILPDQLNDTDLADSAEDYLEYSDEEVNPIADNEDFYLEHSDEEQVNSTADDDEYDPVPSDEDEANSIANDEEYYFEPADLASTDPEVHPTGSDDEPREDTNDGNYEPEDDHHDAASVASFDENTALVPYEQTVSNKDNDWHFIPRGNYTWTGIELTDWGQHYYFDYEGHLGVISNWKAISGVNHGALAQDTWLWYREEDKDYVRFPEVDGQVFEIKVTTPEGEDFYLDDNIYSYPEDTTTDAERGPYGHVCTEKCFGFLDQYGWELFVPAPKMIEAAPTDKPEDCANEQQTVQESADEKHTVEESADSKQIVEKPTKKEKVKRKIDFIASFTETAPNYFNLDTCRGPTYKFPDGEFYTLHALTTIVEGVGGDEEDDAGTDQPAQQAAAVSRTTAARATAARRVHNLDTIAEGDEEEPEQTTTATRIADSDDEEIERLEKLEDEDLTAQLDRIRGQIIANATNALASAAQPSSAAAATTTAADNLPRWVKDPFYVSGRSWVDLDEDPDELEDLTPKPQETTFEKPIPRWEADPFYVSGRSWVDLDEDPDELEDLTPKPKDTTSEEMLMPHWQADGYSLGCRFWADSDDENPLEPLTPPPLAHPQPVRKEVPRWIADPFYVSGKSWVELDEDEDA